MRISNSLSLICAALFCVGGLIAQAIPDTEVQAKARDALRKAMEPPLGVLPPAADPAVIEKAREALRKSIEPSFGIVPPVGDPAIIEKAREALRQKLSEPEAAGMEAAKAAERARADQAKAEAAKAREEAAGAKAAEKAMAQPARGRGEAVKAGADMLGLKEAEKKQAKTRAVFPPMAAPSSPLSASKEARLAELLRQYKADEITPAQYHAERAKIIAEP